jgi:hypothetical protein
MRPRVFALVSRAEDGCVVRAAAMLGATTVVSIAPPDRDAVLRGARAVGASRVVRLWDPALEATDYLGVAYALAATVRALAGDLAAEPTVILCGGRGRGAVGPAVAERLSLPHLGEVVSATAVEGRVVVKRRDAGVVRLYSGVPPMVLCVAGVERLASVDGDGVDEWTLAQSGLTPTELSYRRRFKPHAAPGPHAAPRRFADARALAERLRADGLLVHGGD